MFLFLLLGRLSAPSPGGFVNSVTGPAMYPLSFIKVRRYAFKDVSNTAEPAAGQAPPDPTGRLASLCSMEGLLGVCVSSKGHDGEPGVPSIIHLWSHV